MTICRFLGYKFSDKPGVNGDSGNMLFKGVINEPADFPTSAAVKVGDTYTIGYKEVIANLTNAASVATATASSIFYNNFINGNNIIVSGYTGAEAGYNGTFVGTKGSPNDITYPIAGAPPSPATGIGIIASPDIVIDNDGSKTNTGQTFQNNDEIMWNGASWSLVGPDRIWLENGTEIRPLNFTKLFRVGGNAEFGQEIVALDDIFSGKVGIYNGRYLARRFDGGASTIVKADGKSEFPQGITDLPNPTANLDAVNKQYRDAGVLFNQIYHVRSGGNDINHGRNEENGFLTYSFAFTTVAGQTPSVANQFTVATFDSYVYTGGFNAGIIQYMHVDAQNVTVKSNDATIYSNCTLNVNVLQRDSGIGAIIIKEGSGKATLNAKKAINPIPTGGGLFLDAGILESTIDELTVASSTDTLKSGNPANANKSYLGKHKTTRGKIFTTNITDKDFWAGDSHHGDLSLNAASTIHFYYKEWDGKIAAAGALAKLYIKIDKRLTDPQFDNFDPTANIFIDELESPHISMRPSAATTTFNPSTATTIPYNTLIETAYQIRNTAAGEFTVDVNGRYLIMASYAMDDTTLGNSREIYLDVDNGSGFVRKKASTETQQSVTSDKQVVEGEFKIFLRKGDIIRIQGWHNAALAQAIYGGATYEDRTYIDISKIGN